MTQSKLSLEMPSPEGLPYPTDADFAEENPGQHDHPEDACKAFWARIWRKWKDKKLCYEWYRYRRWHSLEAWEHGFTEFAKKQRNNPERETYGNPIHLVRYIAQQYDAKPERYRRQEAPPLPASIPQPAVKVTVASEGKRRWHEEYLARKAAMFAAKVV